VTPKKVYFFINTKRTRPPPWLPERHVATNYYRDTIVNNITTATSQLGLLFETEPLSFFGYLPLLDDQMRPLCYSLLCVYIFLVEIVPRRTSWLCFTFDMLANNIRALVLEPLATLVPQSITFDTS
jgi:hypothetical protein